jgi:hypothetical protein
LSDYGCLLQGFGEVEIAVYGASDILSPGAELNRPVKITHGIRDAIQF